MMKTITKTLLLFALTSSIFIGCSKDDAEIPTTTPPTTTPPTASNPIVGTWTRYEFYSVKIYQDGTVYENSGSPASGAEITFNADGTYNGTSWGTGTWTYDATSGNVTRTNSGSIPEVIYYNKPQIPWCSLTIPSGAQDPTLYFSYERSNPATGFQYYYTQQRMRKN